MDGAGHESRGLAGPSVPDAERRLPPGVWPLRAPPRVSAIRRELDEGGSSPTPQSTPFRCPLAALKHRSTAAAAGRCAAPEPRRAPHARSTGVQPPMPASAPMGGSRAAHHPPIGSPIMPIGLHHGPRVRFADRSARGQPAIASSPARAGRRRDPRHPPRHPRSVPAPPAAARTHRRAYERPVSDLGVGSQIGILELKIGLGAWSESVHQHGIGHRKI